MLYKVRCCCQPIKVLGVLELANDLRPFDRVPVIIGMPAPANDAASVINRADYEYVEMREFVYRVGSSELAVYSEERPIEFWRQVRGFKECTCGGAPLHYGFNCAGQSRPSRPPCQVCDAGLLAG